MALTTLERYWWGEGEIKFYIDGDEEYPTICGTGTEDYFGGSWSFAKQINGKTVEQNYCTPYMGYPYYSSHDEKIHNLYHNDDCMPMRGFYRWHIQDPICFEEDLKVTIQQIGVGYRGLFERQDDVASVAYWYQAEPHNPFPPMLKKKTGGPDKEQKLKKCVLGILLCSLLLGTGMGCKGKGPGKEIPETGKSGQDEITIMHVDADHPEFQKFIEQAEKELGLKIRIVSYPENADNRQAEVSTILSAGEDSVDIFSVNDEMVSEFKYKGYLEPLNDTVMTEDILSCYPESYMEHIAMLDGKVYSVPYYMDIMVFWVNKSMIGDMEIRTQEDFQRLLETDFGEGRYGYGSAWDSAYVYNELSEFINFFGGSYYDWNSPSTREALTFLADMVKKSRRP